VPVLFAGLRVVSVSNISLVSVAALLGVGNLGMLFTDGLQRTFVTEVVVGIIAILLLALIMDTLLVLLEKLLTPWTRAGAVTAKQDTKAAQFIADAQIHAEAGR
jgi:osmoprotectant transport system permease protein